MRDRSRAFKTILARGLGGCVAGQRFHVESCCSTACRRGRIFSTACASRIIDGSGISGETQVGHFRTAPVERRLGFVRLVGRYRGAGLGHRSRARRHADLPRPCSTTARTSSFIPAITSMPIVRFRRELKLPDGEIWRNIVTEEKSVVAHSLDAVSRQLQIQSARREFSRLQRRGADVRAMGRSRGDQRLVRRSAAADETGYAEDGTLPTGGAGRRAFHEFMPMRADAGARRAGSIARSPMARCSTSSCSTCAATATRTWNKRDDAATRCILGPTQLAWLKRELVASNATWKVIAADLPIGLISEDAVALGDGPPQRREHEIADLLSFMKRAGIRNTVWLTADMHYTAAHYYDPNRAVFQDFEPFWEFVSGPLHAGTWAPGRTRQHVRPEGGVSRRAAAPSRAKTSRPVSGCNSSAMSISTARPKS